MPQVAPQQTVARSFNSTALNVSWMAIDQSREMLRGKLIGHRVCCIHRNIMLILMKYLHTFNLFNLMYVHNIIIYIIIIFIVLRQNVDFFCYLVNKQSKKLYKILNFERISFVTF